MKLVIVESPFSGEIERNITYAKRAIRQCISEGESPIASHLLFTQPGILDDTIPTERTAGINAGLAWRRVCDYAIFFEDYGWSAGMISAKRIYDEENITYFIRNIGKND